MVWCAAQSTPPKETFDDVAALARRALEADRAEDAIRLFTRATAMKPQWAEGWWHLGTLQFDAGRFAPACDAFAHFVAVESKAGAGFGMLGLCQFQLHRNADSLASLERAIRLGLGPNRDFARGALYRDATLHTLLGRPEVALQRLTLLLNQAAADRPGAAPRSFLGDEDVVDALGVAALRLAKLPQDVPADRKPMIRQAGTAQALLALQDPPRAAQEVDKPAAPYGAQPGVHYARGVFLLKTDPPGALAEFRHELQISPRDVDARVQAAFECLRSGDYTAGRDYATEAVKLAPANFAARIVLSRLWLAMEKPGQAAEEARAAVRLAPDSPDAHFTLSRCYALLKRPADAERESAEFQRLKDLADRAAR
jgi:tetratricopeptide (TPR) repeat protein